MPWVDLSWTRIAVVRSSDSSQKRSVRLLPAMFEVRFRVFRFLCFFSKFICLFLSLFVCSTCPGEKIAQCPPPPTEAECQQKVKKQKTHIIHKTNVQFSKKFRKNQTGLGVGSIASRRLLFVVPTGQMRRYGLPQCTTNRSRMRCSSKFFEI